MENQLRALQKSKILRKNEMTCWKRETFFENQICFDKAFKFQWKKTSTAPSYKMLETKKTNTFIQK